MESDNETTISITPAKRDLLFNAVPGSGFNNQKQFRGTHSDYT